MINNTHQSVVNLLASKLFGYDYLLTYHAQLGSIIRITVIGSLLGLGTIHAADSVAHSMIKNYCLDCHDSDVSKGDLNLEKLLTDDITKHHQVWEDVIRRLTARQMPPAKKKRPEEKEYESTLNYLEKTFDDYVKAHPRPGRTETIRRMNRTEYRNAIRDLLAVSVDVDTLLPTDELSHGFDNVTVGSLSPTLLERYITAAQKISRLAVGGQQKDPGGETIRMKPDLTQEDWVEGLPFGTRGGALIPYTFPRDGDYEVRMTLMRDRNEEVEGLQSPHELVVLIDNKQVHSFTIKPVKGHDHSSVDAHLHLRIPVTAGPKSVGITFIKKKSSLEETLRKPYNSHFNSYRHPRLSPALYQVTITGPFASKQPGNSPSRERIFSVYPKKAAEEIAAAKTIIVTLARRAYRRPVTDDDIARPLSFYNEARKSGSFDDGIEAALSAILVSRSFLFRVEQAPAQVKSGDVYKIDDISLASRLSFFLWSSIPDEELLALAEKGELSNPTTLQLQTTRMLADPRSKSLITNFASQWLHLRNLESFTPDGRLFPDFDDNLRQAMRQETQLLFTEILREDKSILNLLQSDHTYLNERLAKHYGIPHVYGTHFRRVNVPHDSNRGGVLRHGSILTVTSYATRTSPVIRGKWVLDTIMGTPPPPPAPDVPALDDNMVSANLPVRARLAEHRANPSCASCHDIMDPVGFVLENYDAIGRWRMIEEGVPVDASGGLPDGTHFIGVHGLEKGLLERPELFATALCDKLLVFALGRGVDYYDASSVRRIVREAQKENYRFSAIIHGIVNSTPFLMREK